MTETKYPPSSDASPSKTSLLHDAQNRLFRPGVQLRMTMAILLLIFTALFPLMMPIGGVLLFIPFTIFVTCPMLYGLAVMAKKAADGEALSIADLFDAFSKRYWYAIRTVLAVLFFSALPVFLLVFCACGAFTVYELTLQSPEYTDMAGYVLVFGIVVCFLALIPAMLFGMPAYLLFALRVKGRISVFSALVRSVRLLSGDLGRYFKLQLRLTALSLLSVLSVCTLFPIYTLPLFMISSALYLERLVEREAPNEENNTITI